VPAVADAALAERLAARTLELIDIPSESRAEARLAAHVGALLGAQDLGDDCVLARGSDRARVLLAGHLDTVPAQGNLPGRRDADRVHGLGASDMKGALAVMIELARDGAPFDCLFFGREELPVAESALSPLLAREPLRHDLVVVMEPTANVVQAGCLGNVNAAWTFRGRSGHSARPWLADNAIERAAAGIAALAAQGPQPHAFDGLTFTEVATVTRIAGGIADNVVPDRVDCHVNFRSAPGRTPAEAEARLRELCAGHGELEVLSNSPSGPVPEGNPLVDALREAAGGALEPKQAWTPVAEFGQAGLDAVNLGPGDPGEAHRREESIAVAALVEAYRILERLAEAA
jgi:succinyl-diaminopimelate desuccinylase